MPRLRKRKSKDKSNTKEENKARVDTTRIFAYLFIALAAGSYYASAYYNRLTMPILSDVLKLLSGSFLTTGIFSILLGFSDFMKYVTRRLREIIIERTYLRTLSGEERGKLKTDIDEIIFGEGAIKDPGSLYSFFEGKLTQLFRSPYRAAFYDMYYISNSEDADFWFVDNHTSYNLYRGQMEDRMEKLKIAWGTQTPLPDTVETKPFKYYLKKINIALDNDLMTLRFDDQAAQFRLDANKNNSYLKEIIDVSAEITKLGDASVLEISFEIEIPNEMIYDDKDFVKVEIKNEMLIFKKDNMLHLRMTYPTKDMMLSCNFRDGNNRMDCVGFGFDPSSHILRKSPNSAFVNIKEWICPGHGAVITWVPLD